VQSLLGPSIVGGTEAASYGVSIQDSSVHSLLGPAIIGGTNNYNVTVLDPNGPIPSGPGIIGPAWNRGMDPTGLSALMETQANFVERAKNTSNGLINSGNPMAATVGLNGLWAVHDAQMHTLAPSRSDYFEEFGYYPTTSQLASWSPHSLPVSSSIFG
jgi:hypothetical protein